jgi:hypothetical protein
MGLAKLTLLTAAENKPPEASGLDLNQGQGHGTQLAHSAQ